MAGLSVSQCREGERKGRVALRSYSHSVSQSVQSHASLTPAHQRRSRLEFTALLTVQVGHTLPLTCSLRRDFKSLENLSITCLSSGILSDILALSRKSTRVGSCSDFSFVRRFLVGVSTVARS